ncbi:hypothetical protein [Anaerosolibacter sp.]|uniref:hypothetical protein n=1 Tax=Anaerosolibacter sp. TaxID=1872527 RepID=UPI0039EED302
MSEVKKPKQKKVKVNEVEYTIQSIPFMSYVEMQDRHKNRHGVIMQAGYIKELMESCVVDPSVSMSDFDDDFSSAQMLINEIETFLNAGK